MAKKPRLPKSAVIIQAEIRLETLSQLLRYQGELEKKVTAEIDAVRARWAEEVDAAETAITAEHKDLVKLMKGYKGELFDKTDRVKLDNGILIHAKEDHVVIPKGAVEAIEAQGWNEAVVITKTVDREVVNAWPVERLTLIGAAKKPKETFDYEIADDPRNLDSSAKVPKTNKPGTVNP